MVRRQRHLQVDEGEVVAGLAHVGLAHHRHAVVALLAPARAPGVCGVVQVLVDGGVLGGAREGGVGQRGARGEAGVERQVLARGVPASFREIQKA